MVSTVTSPEQYIKELPADRKQAFIQLRDTVVTNLPDDFKEVMSYSMIGYVVPHNEYSRGIIATRNFPCHCRHSFTRKFYCHLSYGDICYARVIKMVQNGIS